MRYLMILAGIGMAYYAYQHLSKVPAQDAPALVAPPPAENPPPVFGEEELEKVRASTTDSDPKVRWEAAQFLANARDPQADAILVNMLKTDDSAQLRKDVIDLLGHRGDLKFSKYIVSALKDSEVDVRLAALANLGRLGDYTAAPAISECLRDVDERVRLAALQTLNELQTKHNAQVAKIEGERKAYQEEMARRQKEAEKRK